MTATRPEPGVLRVADVVLDPGVGAVTGLQEGQLAEPAGCTDRGVGGEQLVAPAVGLVEQGQLSAGEGAFAAADDASGKIRLYNAAGTVNIAADLIGFYAPESTSAYSAVSPVRVLDTRTGLGAAKAPVAAGKYIDLTLAGTRGVPADATAVVLNVTGINLDDSRRLRRV